MSKADTLVTEKSVLFPKLYHFQYVKQTQTCIRFDSQLTGRDRLNSNSTRLLALTDDRRGNE